MSYLGSVLRSRRVASLTRRHAEQAQRVEASVDKVGQPERVRCQYMMVVQDVYNRSGWHRRQRAIGVALCMVALGLFGCAPDIGETDFYSLHPEEEVESEVLTLGTQTVGSWTLALKARTALHVGYNRLLIEAVQGDAPVEKATVQLTPRRQGQAAPLDAPVTVQADADGYLGVGAYFLQPKGDAQAWMIQMVLETQGQSVVADFDVTVQDSLWMQTLLHPETGATYYLSWVQPVRPTTGEDDLAFAIHEATTTGFVPVTDVQLDAYPYMDMGAGEGHSTPYEAPTHDANGLYRGQINFIMSGGWDLTLFIDHSSAPRDTVVFRGFTVY